MADSPPKELPATVATQLMRELSEDARIEAIEAAPNVVGYDRFCAQAAHVAMTRGK